MRIAHVYPVPGGGVQRYVDALNKGLKQISPDIEIVHMIVDLNGEAKNTFAEREWVEKFTFSLRTDLSHSLLDDCINPQAEEEFERLLDVVNPDIVHFHDLSFLGASLIGTAKERQVSTVVSLHDYWMICPRSFLLKRDLTLCHGPNEGSRCLGCFSFPGELQSNLFKDSITRFQFMKNILSNKTDKILTVSESIRKKLISEGIPSEKMSVIYPALEDPVAMDMLNSRSDRSHLNVGYIGAVSPHKGLHVLLGALSDIPEDKFSLHIYGTVDTLYYSSLRTLIGDRHNIKFHGGYKHNELSEIFSWIDVLVVPSVCPETGPLVVQEALRHKVPVIGSNIGGIPEYVNDRYGTLFEAGNKDELHSILIKLFNDRQQIEFWKTGIPKLDHIQSFAQNVLHNYQQVLQISKEKPFVNVEHIRLLGKHDRGFLRHPYIYYQLQEIYRMFTSSNLRKIAIFGTGILGIKVSDHVKANGFEVVVFVDNNANKQGTVINGTVVIAPEQISEQNIDAVLIVSDWEADIAEQLHSMQLTIPSFGVYSFDPIDLDFN